MKRDKLRRKERQDEAKQRQEIREARGDAAQLELLEEMGHGHCKEANRLRKRLQKKEEK